MSLVRSIKKFWFKSKLIFFALFLTFSILFYFLYLKNQALFIFGGDSSEFSFIAKNLSISHPPGYPLYSSLINLTARLIPFSSITWRASIISSLSTILTAFLLFKLLYLNSKSYFISLVSSLLYIFLFPVWLYSEVPEVFALNSLIIAAITYLIFLNLKKEKRAFLFLISLFLGLGISHHHTFILFIPAWYLLLRKDLPNILKKNTIALIIFFFIGLAFYILAPISSWQNSPLDWENAKTLIGFIKLITRSSYGTFSAFQSSSPNLINQLIDILSIIRFLYRDFRIIGIITIIAGFFYLRKLNIGLYRFVLVSFIAEIVFVFYTNFFLINLLHLAAFERFLTFIYLVLIFPFSYGILYYIFLFKKLTKKYIHNFYLKFIVEGVPYLFMVLFVVIIFIRNYPIIAKVKHLPQFDTFSQDILNTLPPNTIVYIASDSIFSVYYQYYINHLRSDVCLVSINLITQDYYQRRLRKDCPSLFIPKNMALTKKKIFEFLNTNNKKREIFFESPISNGYWLPYGLLWKYFPARESAVKKTEKIIEINNRLWHSLYSIPLINAYTKDIFYLKDLEQYYMDRYNNYALLLEKNRKNKLLNIVYQIILDYDKNNVAANTGMLKLMTVTNKCKKPNVYFDNIDENDRSLSIERLKIIIRYLAKCDNKNSRIEDFMIAYMKQKRTEEISLDQL